MSEKDPLGRRALFSHPTTALMTPPHGDGKESLYSASARTLDGDHRWWTVVVDCSSCGEQRRVSWAEFSWRHLPFWLWIPWQRHSQFMSCPACQRRTWLAVSFFS